MTLRIFHWLSRCFLAGIFFYTGYKKIFPRPIATLDFGMAVSAYELFPEKLVPLIAEYFPWVEIALALLLLIGWKKIIRYVAGVAAAQMLFFIVILTITYARGKDISCGCGIFEGKISPLTIARDGVIIIPALYLLAEPLLRRKKQV
jgi:putative oxidoreductase